MRVGYGYDLHRLAPGRDLWLGGIRIDYDRGLVGHSDADVLVHAVADALLGAAALGDIGQHFPEHDGRWRDLKGSALMERVMGLIAEKKFKPVNVDCVIHAEKPKLSQYRDAIRKSIADMARLPAESVNVKFKTNEGLDAVGRGEAISASAVALLSDA
ncbi:2-C-methyl-D-erythritol 2,4-cyclodiphosphate synthase [bacterium]|nr:2-C-methyl-D-erythritol 2,4-cyclodiphosphate synthase [bacterium]